MSGRVYSADKGDANGEGDEARQFRSSGSSRLRSKLTRADGISEEAKRATSGRLSVREKKRGFWCGGLVCGRGQEGRGLDVCLNLLRLRG